MKHLPRASSLSNLSQCPGFHVLRSGPKTEGGSGSAAADSGSAVGRLIELWHNGGEGADAFEQAVYQTSIERDAKFAAADMDLVKSWALAYVADPRNRGVVVKGSCEMDVSVTLPADPDDPGGPITFPGHIDQLRRDSHGTLRLWDIKSGKPEGREMLKSYAWQLACYAAAVEATLHEPCLVGGIIRLRGYIRERGGPVAPAEANVHYHAVWTREEHLAMLETPVWLIGHIRRGVVPLMPGTHCNWCPGKDPGACATLVAETWEKNYGGEAHGELPIL